MTSETTIEVLETYVERAQFEVLEPLGKGFTKPVALLLSPVFLIGFAAAYVALAIVRRKL